MENTPPSTDSQPQQYTPFVPPKLNRDENGYVESFSADQEKELVEFFFKYGFVVIRDAIPSEFVEKTVSSVWSTYMPKISREKRETWLDAKWNEVFGSSYNTKRGFLGYYPAVSDSAWQNRQHPNMLKAFRAIYGRQDLWAKVDRFGFMRPTRGLIDSSGQIVDKPDWETERSWIHFDLNPWMEPDFCRVQGVLALSDHTATSGGFHCIPGFPPYLTTWAKEHANITSNGCLIDIPKDDPVLAYVEKISMRPGSITIWDSRTPHGNFPNEDTSYRMCQYITFFPAPQDPKFLKPRQEEITMCLDHNPPPKLTLEGKKICGFEEYTEEERNPPNPTPVNLNSKYNLNQWGLR